MMMGIVTIVIIIIAFINVRIADRQLANGTWWSSLLFRHLSWALGAGGGDEDDNDEGDDDVNRQWACLCIMIECMYVCDVLPMLPLVEFL